MMFQIWVLTMFQTGVFLICLLEFHGIRGESIIGNRDNPRGHFDENSKCECGVFRTAELAEDYEPLLVQSPIAVTCDEAGRKTCQEMCTSLGKLSKEKGPSILCATLGHGDDLKPSIFSRVCNTGQWYYTGLTAKEPICCHSNEVILCKPTTA